MSEPFEFIEVYSRDGVGVIILNRPKQLNALNRKLVSEIVTAMERFDQNDEVISILITGKGRAFSAGADIDEMSNNNPIQSRVIKSICGLGSTCLDQEANHRCCERICFWWRI